MGLIQVWVLLVSLVLNEWIFSASAAGEVLSTHGDRIELDWSSNRMRFYGQSKPDQGSQDFRELEQLAWQEGLQYASLAIRELYSDYYPEEPASPAAKQAAEDVTRSTHSQNTIYFAEGGVQVELENTISRALGGMPFKFAKESPDAPNARNSALVIHLPKSITPRPVFKVVSESQAVLLSVDLMSRSGFRENLMGRWFSGKALERFVGNRAVELTALKVHEDEFVVRQEDWDRAQAGNQRLIEEAKIAIVLPSDR